MELQKLSGWSLLPSYYTLHSIFSTFFAKVFNFYAALILFQPLLSPSPGLFPQEDTDSSMDSSQLFFIVILRHMLTDDKISLPIETVKKIGVKIPYRVVFKLPDGLKWEMGVIKSEEMVWFHKGWRDFRDHYGLDHGSFVMLEFDGKSAFKVNIFDTTANQISYPRCQKTFKNIGNTIKVERDLRGKASVLDPRPFKKVKPGDPWPAPAEFRDWLVVSDDEEDGEEERGEVIIPISERKTVSAPKKAQALERTSASKSANPFFEICIGTSSILQASLHIPGKFANKYLASNVVDKVTFKVGNRRWEVKVKRYNCAIKFSGGWRTFAKDNGLQVRDVCVFELVGDRYEFQVSILRFS